MNYDKDQVLPAAVGMWPNILQSLAGIGANVFNEKKEHPCPLCGGKSRFRYIKKNDNPFFCNQCGTRSGINFYMELTGLGFSEAINDVGDFLNLIPVEKRELIQKKHIVSNSFPAWYKFDFDLYQSIKEKAEVKLSPWQRVNALNMLDLLAYDKYTLVELLNKSGDACDFMMFDVDGNCHSTSGNTIEPEGFYSVFGSNPGKHAYLTTNPVTAAKSSVFMGVKVVCCYSIENMASVLHNFYEHKVIAIVSDITETMEADDLQLSQLTFNKKTKTLNLRLWLPGEIVKAKQEKENE